MTGDARPRKAADLSPEERFAYSARHIYYEVLMLRNAIARQQPADPFIETWLMEICVLHARNLIEFLFHKADRTTLGYDLYLEPGFAWSPPEMSPAINRIKFRGDKQVAHLTTSRQTEEVPEEPYDRAPFLDLLSIFDSFVEDASPRLLDKDVLRGRRQSGIVVQGTDGMHSNTVSQTFVIRSRDLPTDLP